MELLSKESAQKDDPGDKNSPDAPAGTRTSDLSIMRPVLCTPELSPLSACCFVVVVVLLLLLILLSFLFISP